MLFRRKPCAHEHVSGVSRRRFVANAIVNKGLHFRPHRTIGLARDKPCAIRNRREDRLYTERRMVFVFSGVMRLDRKAGIFRERELMNELLRGVRFDTNE